MSTHVNAEAVVAWVRQRPSATVSDIAASGLMSSRTASDAVQYALRCGALERVIRRAMSAKDRVHYRATGVTLPAPRAQSVPTFDGLLTAWGIVLEPPQIRALDSRRYLISDHE